MIEKLENIRINVNTKLISLDVKDMFTNITVNKVIKLVNDNNMGAVSYTHLDVYKRQSLWILRF